MKVTKQYFAQLSHCDLVFCVNENKIRASNKKNTPKTGHGENSKPHYSGYSEAIAARQIDIGGYTHVIILLSSSFLTVIYIVVRSLILC